MNEFWLPVTEFADYYEVSSIGRIRRISSGRILSQHSVSRGYKQVTLSVAGKQYARYVHRLVALAFLDEPSVPNLHARHYDGDKLNNQASNIRWGTPAQNAQDRSRHGTHYSHFRGVTHCIRNHEFTEENTRRTSRGRACRKCAVLHSRAYRARLHGS